MFENFCLFLILRYILIVSSRNNRITHGIIDRGGWEKVICV